MSIGGDRRSLEKKLAEEVRRRETTESLLALRDEELSILKSEVDAQRQTIADLQEEKRRLSANAFTPDDDLLEELFAQLEVEGEGIHPPWTTAGSSQSYSPQKKVKGGPHHLGAEFTRISRRKGTKNMWRMPAKVVHAKQNKKKQTRYASMSTSETPFRNTPLGIGPTEKSLCHLIHVDHIHPSNDRPPAPSTRNERPMTGQHIHEDAAQAQQLAKSHHTSRFFITILNHKEICSI
ncbi:hypothetical protein QR680_012851 [Steinernema hermaphroditum]|uniref:Uncharacterized protein n=1 Tax=Steinernema hermaphroditum TaxID=289476 RepID=A0AA39I3H5_9BILA|nr:hypothetical protein QR680_012851 [Steinernema hermaphroditum]